MPQGPPLDGIFLGHMFCKYPGWGWSELFAALQSWRQAKISVCDFLVPSDNMQLQLHIARSTSFCCATPSSFVRKSYLF